MHAEQAVDIVDHKVRVLEEAEDREVVDDVEDELELRKAGPAVFQSGVDDTPRREVEQNAQEHQDDVHRLAPCVEHEASKEQDAVFDRDVLRQRHADPVVEEQRQRQERHQEGRGTEYHGVSSFCLVSSVVFVSFSKSYKAFLNASYSASAFFAVQ